jgi:hypothetical protein
MVVGRAKTERSTPETLLFCIDTVTCDVLLIIRSSQKI